MPFNMAAFAEAAPGANGKISAGSKDSLYNVNADDLIITEAAPFLLGIFCSAETTGGRFLLKQPTLSIDYEFSRILLMTDPATRKGYTHMFGRPLPLVAKEKLNVEAVNATDEDALIGLLLGSGKITQANLDAVNPTHRITGYADQTLTAMEWGDVTITWNQDLPEGRYAVVGMIYGLYKSSAAMPALARLLTANKNWRPGVPSTELQADKLELQESIGVQCEHWPLMQEVAFEHDRPPNLQVLGAEAGTDHVLELLLQKIR